MKRMLCQHPGQRAPGAPTSVPQERQRGGSTRSSSRPAPWRKRGSKPPMRVESSHTIPESYQDAIGTARGGVWQHCRVMAANILI